MKQSTCARCRNPADFGFRLCTSCALKTPRRPRPTHPCPTCGGPVRYDLIEHNGVCVDRDTTRPGP